MTSPAHERAHRRAGADEGQAMPLLVMLVVLAGVSALALSDLGVAAVSRAKARTAADAAALAGAAEGREAATAVAEANGAALESFEVMGAETEVVVRVGEARARARARRSAPDACGQPPGGDPIHSPVCPPTSHR